MSTRSLPAVRRLLPALACLALLGPPLPAGAALSITQTGLIDGCNSDTANSLVDFNEYIQLVVKVTNSGPESYTDVRCLFTTNDSRLFLGRTRINDITPPTWTRLQQSILGDLPANTSARCRMDFVLATPHPACSPGNIPEIYVSIISRQGNFGPIGTVQVPCTGNASTTANPMAGEVHNIFATEEGTSVRFHWTPMSTSSDDRYQIYKGDLQDLDDEFPSNRAISTGGTGVCSEPGTQHATTLSCPSPVPAWKDCVEPGYHLDYLDPAFSLLNHDYRISGEKKCPNAALGYGAEGTLGSWGITPLAEFPYGGGNCPPMD